MEKILREKETALKIFLKNLGSAAVAFSGGVDSTYLLHAAHEVLGDRAMAVTISVASVPARELAEAKAFCAERGIRHEILKLDQFAAPGFRENPKDRCYLCKRFLFTAVKNLAAAEGFAHVADGTNADDVHGYRPGLRALTELSVVSPLKEAGLTKADIRALSREAGLPTWDKPSFACLATRFPYGEILTEEKLARAEAAENFLFGLGMTQLRVRCHGDLARIEALPAEMEMLFRNRERVAARFQELGFRYVTMDLMGFRSGSMDGK